MPVTMYLTGDRFCLFLRLIKSADNKVGVGSYLLDNKPVTAPVVLITLDTVQEKKTSVSSICVD